MQALLYNLLFPCFTIVLEGAPLGLDFMTLRALPVNLRFDPPSVLWYVTTTRSSLITIARRQDALSLPTSSNVWTTPPVNALVKLEGEFLSYISYLQIDILTFLKSGACGRTHANMVHIHRRLCCILNKESQSLKSLDEE